MLVDTDDLMTNKDVAHFFGVGQSTISNWRTRTYKDFPEPVVTLSGTSLWLRQDILAWYKRRFKMTPALRAILDNDAS